jgi:hypothetical protein
MAMQDKHATDTRSSNVRLHFPARENEMLRKKAGILPVCREAHRMGEGQT